MTPPVGIVNVPIDDFIDIDVFCETSNRKYGKAFSSVRVRDSGHFRNSVRWNVTLAVGTSGFKHLVITEENTSTITFISFIRQQLDRLVVVEPGRRKVFLWDNLNVHYCDEVYS